MKFKRYASIDNSYRIKTIQFIRELLPNKQFVVQEKLHGSNFAVYTDGNEVKYAKRSNFLKEGNFNSYKKLDLVTIEKSIKEIFTMFKDLYPETKQISIHGEICGGSYPHDDVKVVQDVSRVQKEVLYSPNVEFFAFDIKIDDAPINMDKFFEVCEIYNIQHIPSLFQGTLEECLLYSNEYQTTIPKMLGLPKIEDNICEGNVIKPIIAANFDNGGRVVVKNKNEKFSERSGQKGTPKPADPLPENILSMMELGNTYVCENRLRNVLSKIGEVTHKDFGMILGRMSKDVVEDFRIDYKEKLDELNKKENNKVIRYLNGKISMLIRENFDNIVDGEF